MEFDLAGCNGKDCIIITLFGTGSRIKFIALLAHQNIAGYYLFSAKSFYTQSFGNGIFIFSGTSATCFVGHGMEYKTCEKINQPLNFIQG